MITRAKISAVRGSGVNFLVRDAALIRVNTVSLRQFPRKGKGFGDDSDNGRQIHRQSHSSLHDLLV